MATIRLGRYEVEEYDLPPMCAKCGRKAFDAPDKTFAWSPSWLPVLILLGLLGLILYLVLSLSLTKRMTVSLPLCERHRNYWRNRALVLYGGLVGWVLLSVLGLVVAAVLYGSPSQDDWSFGIAGLSAGGLFLVYLITAAISYSSSIRPGEITDRSITLTGLSRDFVEEVREDRRGDEDEDEDDWPRRKRMRGDEDDPRYYDPRAKRHRRRDEDEDER